MEDRRDENVRDAACDLLVTCDLDVGEAMLAVARNREGLDNQTPEGDRHLTISALLEGAKAALAEAERMHGSE